MSEFDPAMQDEQGGVRDRFGRWKPGTSGNPRGRPAVSLLSVIRNELERVDPEGRVPLEIIARSYVDWLTENCKAGNVGTVAASIRDLADRLDGKAGESLRLQTGDPAPAPLIILRAAKSSEAAEGEGAAK